MLDNNYLPLISINKGLDYQLYFVYEYLSQTMFQVEILYLEDRPDDD